MWGVIGSCFGDSTVMHGNRNTYCLTWLTLMAAFIWKAWFSKYYLNHSQLIKRGLCSAVGQKRCMLLLSHISHSEFLIHTVSQGIPLLTSCFRNLSYDNCQGLHSFFFVVFFFFFLTLNIKSPLNIEVRYWMYFFCVWLPACIWRLVWFTLRLCLKAFPVPVAFQWKLIYIFLSLSSEMGPFSCIPVLH